MSTQGLPVHGYRPQDPERVAAVNEFKKMEETLLRVLDTMVGQSEIDQRWLSIGRTQIEQGFMAVNRSIFRPGRVALPEEDSPVSRGISGGLK